jgi:predicted glycogen debranching enzyme
MEIMKEWLTFDKDPVSVFQNREWLVTNGLGGYASTSLCLLNTRRYHGMLIASLQPPVSRRVLVSRVDISVTVDGQKFDLSTNQYPGVFHPEGFRHIQKFRRDPIPSIAFEAGGATLRFSCFMPQGSNTTVLLYENESDRVLSLHLHPQLVERDLHGLFHRHETSSFFTSDKGKYQKVYPTNESIPVFLKATAGKFFPQREWYYNVEYYREQERGYPFSEDTFSPGYFAASLKPSEKIFLILSVEEDAMKADPEKWLADELARLEEVKLSGVSNEFTQDLYRSSDQFVAWRDSTHSQTLMAGYPWFADWGRDALYSVRGLAIETGRKDLAESVIQNFLLHLRNGLLPNRFPDDNSQPEYNSVDAALWLFISLYEYEQNFGDLDFVASCFPAMEEIMSAYIKGTDYGIHCIEEFGFICAGSRQTQLTWMDARIWGHSITPRWGCPVEVNALWYNALKIFAYFDERLNGNPERYETIRLNFEKHFRPRFFNPKGYLNDLLEPVEEETDPSAYQERFNSDESIRPNQIFAISLPFPLIKGNDAKAVLKTVKKHLLTSYGLRSLSPEHPDYKGFYGGSQWNRDSAYHQGTTWPFLLGEYYEAYLKYHGDMEPYQDKVKKALGPLIDHFYHSACLYAISEIFDGDNPGPGKGAFHQAWSVSSLLRLLLRHGI